MNSKVDLGDRDTKAIVYVRSVAVADLPEDIQAEVSGLKNIYAVHSENGDRLALVNTRDLAFHLAREHDYTPLTVH